jgi:Arc/MetJ family transcription regulator
MIYYVYNNMEGNSMHRTNIELDEGLVEEAMKLTKRKTRKDVVNYALSELVRKLKRKKLLRLEGKVKWPGDLGEMRKSRI